MKWKSTRRSLCSDLCKFFLQFFSSFVLLMARRALQKNQKVKKVVMRTSESVINFANYYFSLFSFSTKCSNFFCINLNKFLLQKCLNWKLRTKQQQEQDPTNLYLANLPLTFKETDVEQLLAKYGQVISTRILRDQQGTSKGESRWLHPRHAGTNYRRHTQQVSDSLAWNHVRNANKSFKSSMERSCRARRTPCS